MNFWLQFAVSTGAGAILLAIINAIINRKRLGAETDGLSAAATKTITEAAAGVAADQRKDNAELRSRIIEAAERIDSLEEQLETSQRQHRRDKDRWLRQDDEWRRTLHRHEEWDRLAVHLLQQGVPPQDIPPAPPLYPPPPYESPSTS
jgi:hypothetical protein